MKQTAVEWLVDEIIMLEEKLRLEEININDFMDAKDELVSKALEMEKQQQGYSEEEVIKILYQFHYDLVNSNFDTKEEWFEQFKNK